MNSLFGVWFRSIRVLTRRPIYPIVCLVILSLGLSGAITAFAYINSFNQVFPGVEPNGLVQLFGTEEDVPYQNISFLDYQDYAGAETSFEGIAAVQNYYAASVRFEDLTEVAFLEAVAGSYFGVLGVDAAIGRLLTQFDDRLESPPAAVISYAWWQSHYGGERDVLGQTLYLNSRPFTIVGVASPKFVGSVANNRPHAWISIAHFRDRYVSWDRQALNRDIPLVRVFGRLASGTTIERGTTELAGIARNLDEAYPRPEHTRGIRVESATWIDPRVALQEASTNRIMVLSAFGFLLLVCANVANLLLSLFSARMKTFALQAALGASPARIAREIVVQNLLLSGLAGVIALLLSVPLTGRLGSYFARPSVWGETVPREFGIDSHVVGFALMIAVITGIIAAALPVLHVLRRGAAEILKSESAQGGPRPRFMRVRLPGTRDVLVSAQIALAVILLVVSGLVLKTLSVASDVDPGFDYARLVGSHVSTSSTGVQPNEREQFFRQLEEHISKEPWVESATVSGNAPLSGHASMGLTAEGADEDVSALLDQVHVGFFSKLGISLRDGRPFTAADSAGGVPVAVLNAPAAARFFPTGGAVGRRLTFQRSDGSAAFLEVVGVVGDYKVTEFLAPAQPAVFLPYAQQVYPTGSALLVTTTVSPERAVMLLQQWLREYEPHLAIINSVSYEDVVRGALYTQRMNAELFTFLALFGLLLACAGVFSVVSLSVLRRRREIGIRKAIGSTAGGINALMVRQAMSPVVIGGIIGLAVATLSAKLLASLLYGVSASDPAVLGAGIAVLGLAALVAAFLPAARASRADPVSALRTE